MSEPKPRQMVDSIEVDAMLRCMADQRNRLADEVVVLAGRVALLEARISDLESMPLDSPPK